MDTNHQRSAESSSTKGVKNGISIWIVISAWFCMTILLFAKLAMYSQSPGGQGMPPMAVVAGIHSKPDRHTLVVAIHPKCPCTQSTIYELARLAPKVNNKIDYVFYIYTADESPKSWFNDSAEQLKARFPGSIVIEDKNGKGAERIGAKISGSTVLYAPEGLPVFWGGVTSGRGHSGDNLGSDSIVAIVNGHKPPRESTLVYGCEISINHSNHLFGACSDTSSEICKEQREVASP